MSLVSGQPTEPPDDTPAAAEDVPPPAVDLPESPVTGDPVLDEATRRVAETFGEPLEVQVEAYERAHRALQDRLADVES